MPPDFLPFIEFLRFRTKPDHLFIVFCNELHTSRIRAASFHLVPRRLSENKLIVPKAAPRRRDILAGLPPARFPRNNGELRYIEQLFAEIYAEIWPKYRAFARSAYSRTSS